MFLFMSFNIRQVTSEEDWIFFKDLEFASFLTTLPNAEELSLEEQKRLYKEFDESDPLEPRDPNHHILILETEEGKRAGLIWLCNRDPFWMFTDQHVWVYNLHIVGEFRQQGLARKLMLVAEDWTREQSLSKIALHAIDSNTVVRQLYESLGYKLVATHNESCFYEKKLE